MFFVTFVSFCLSKVYDNESFLHFTLLDSRSLFCFCWMNFFFLQCRSYFLFNSLPFISVTSIFFITVKYWQHNLDQMPGCQRVNVIFIHWSKSLNNISHSMCPLTASYKRLKKIWLEIMFVCTNASFFLHLFIHLNHIVTKYTFKVRNNM